MPRPLAARLAALSLAPLAVLTPAAAQARTPISVARLDLLGGTSQLTAPTAVRRSCFAGPLAAGTPGVIRKQLTTGIDGYVDAKLHGTPTGDDWDLAVFDATGRKVGASAAFGGNELVSAPVAAGSVLTVQACRISGDADPIALTVGERVVSGELPAAQRESLVSIPVRSQEDVRLLAAAGIDLNETSTSDKGIDAVLHGADDRRRVRDLGFTPTTRIADLAEHDAKQARVDPIGSVVPSALPSKRQAYRHLEDYQQDLKDLVAAHPGVVRPLILPHTSVEGRTIEGVEIATDVARTDDGRPTVFQLGLHHVREWSSGEVTIEYAMDLFDKARDAARKQAVLDGERTFVIPVVNPDGLVATQVAGDYVPSDDLNVPEGDPAETGLGGIGAGTGPAVVGAGSYRRKNCANTAGGDVPVGAPCALQDGVDLNRNYGAFWGGPGESDDPTSQTFRGPSPFSEPETQNIHDLSSGHQVTIVNSNHNYAGDVLYQPGFNGADEPGLPKGTIPPYQAQMKELSDRIAAAAHYASFVSYNLYDVTGATEDWNYFAQGAYGYTTEVGYGNFHPNYQDAVIDQYTGSADGVNSIARGESVSKGLRESMLLTGEEALKPLSHATLTGTAPAGRVLRLQKTFTTSTSFVVTGGVTGAARQVPEHLDSTLTVPASGAYTWAVNPSTRPVELLAGRTEAWTMTCEDTAGKVLETQSVVVAMGQTKSVPFTCAATSPPTATTTTTTTTPPTTEPPAATTTTTPAAPGAPGSDGTPGAAGPAGPPGATQTITVPAPATPPPAVVPAAQPRLIVTRAPFSAKRTQRVGSIQVRLRVFGGATARGVTIKLLGARGQTLFGAKLASLKGAKNVRVRPVAALDTLGTGPVTVRVTATLGGRQVTVTKATSIVR